MVRVCFVCLGNIFGPGACTHNIRPLVAEHGLQDKIVVDSAGTASYHVGEKADKRSRQAAASHQVDLTSRARQFVSEDFSRFDYILAMDRNNRRDILSLAENDDERRRVYLFRDFDETSAPQSDVPDPYYGGEAGFENVFQICRRGCEGLLEHIRREHQL